MIAIIGTIGYVYDGHTNTLHMRRWKPGGPQGGSEVFLPLGTSEPRKYQERRALHNGK